MGATTTTYSGIPVWEVQIGEFSVVRKQTDHSINLTQFLNVLGVHRLRREEYLAHYRSLPIAHCWVVHGGPARLKGTWGPFSGVKGLVAELGQQQLFAALLDETLVPDATLVAAVPVASTSANAGVPVVVRRTASRPSAGAAAPRPARVTKRVVPSRRPRSGSTSSSDLTSIADSDMSGVDEAATAPRPAPRRAGLRERVPRRAGSGRLAESRKGKEREWMDVDGQALGGDAGAHVSNTSSLDRVEDLLPELLPDVSVFSQLFGPSKPQSLAALAYLRDLKVPKLAPDYDDSDADEVMQETTPKDSVTIDGVRIQAASSAGSATSHALAQPPPIPQSPRAYVEKVKTDAGMPMNLGQLFDLKLKQREAKLAAAAATPPLSDASLNQRARTTTPALTPVASPITTAPSPAPPVNFRKIQRPESTAPSTADSLTTASSTPTLPHSTPVLQPGVGLAEQHPLGSPVAAFDKNATPEKPVASASFFRLSPVLPVVPAADYALAGTRCPPAIPNLPN